MEELFKPFVTPVRRRVECLLADVSCKHEIYEPLDTTSNQIRLLELLPSENPSIFTWGGYLPNDRIVCRLMVKNLDDSPSYEALSYTWGNADYTKSIRLEGHSVLIRTNLADALMSLRHPTQSRILWTDALCINQQDVRERNHQVGQMGKIYSQAAEVLVWLGDGDRMSSQQPEYWLQESPNTPSVAVRFIKGLGESRFIYSGEQPAALAALCGRSYWNRLWIVQEILLAAKITIYTGRGQTFQWYEFTYTRKMVESILAKRHLDDSLSADEYDRAAFSPLAIKALETIDRSLAAKLDRLRERRKEGWPLHELLMMCGTSLCQDPRDKIYGLLGIASDYKLGDIVVDYRRSYLEVFSDVVKFHNSSHDRRQKLPLDTLTFSELVQRVLGGPWAPGENIFYPELTRSDDDSTASTPDIFRIEGFKVGSILPLEILIDDNTIRDLQQRDTLCALVDYIPHYSRSKLSTMLEYLDGLEKERIITIRNTASYATEIDEPSHPLQTTDETSKTIIKGKGQTRFFVTSAGDFGIASTSIREGDMLCRFAGCEIAVIVRQNGAYYSLVSRALVPSEPIVPSNAVADQSQTSMASMAVRDNSPLHFWLDLNTLHDLSCIIARTDKHKNRENILIQEASTAWNELGED